MRKLISLEFKNNRVLYISILGVFVFSVIIVTLFKFIYGNYKMDTDNYLWVVVLGLFMVLPITLFQAFKNEKYGLYLILNDNRLKQFTAKLILPITTTLIYFNIINLLIDLVDQIAFMSVGFVIDNINVINNYIIFPSLIFLLVIVFLKYCKKGVSLLYKSIFIVLIVNYIIYTCLLFDSLLIEKFTYLYLMTCLLFDSLLLAATYFFYSKIEV